MKICIGVSVGKDIRQSTQAGDQESSHVNESLKYQNILSKIKGSWKWERLFIFFKK